MRPSPIVTALAHLCFGPLVWLAHFSSLYLAATVLCLERWRGARVLGAPALEAAIALLTVLAAALLVLALMRRRRRAEAAGALPETFRRVVPPLLEALALLAVLWQAAVALLVPAC